MIGIDGRRGSRTVFERRATTGRAVGAVPGAGGVLASPFASRPAVSPGAPPAASAAVSPVASARRPRRRRVYGPATLAVAVFHLRHLLLAGVPPADALNAVAELEPRGARRTLWREIAARVTAGASLSRALAAHPADIDATALALVSAGEASGRLGATLAELEAYLRRRHELAARLRTATLYPAFATLLLVVVIGYLLGYVVPSLAGFLVRDGTTLPWHGRLLLVVADTIGRRWPILLGAVGLPIAALALAAAFGERVPRVSGARLPRLPIVGGPITSFRAARWARTVALLHGGGVPLPDALQVAEGTLGNRALERELGAARAAVLGGRTLGEALARCRHLPAPLARIVAAGESAGALDTALERGAAQLELAADHAVARLEALLGPALLCASGALLLWIALSVLAPLYDGVAVLGGGA